MTTEIVTDPETGGKKGRKPQQMHALDPRALLKVAETTTHGGTVYGDPENYRKGYDWSLSFDAMQRHALQFWDGEDNDPESGLPHLAHVAWHALALLSFLLRGKGRDDRYKERNLVTSLNQADRELLVGGLNDRVRRTGVPVCGSVNEPILKLVEGL